MTPERLLPRTPQPEASNELSYRSGDRTTPLRQSTVGSVLEAAALAEPGRVGLVEGTQRQAERRRWTFEQMYDESSRLARALLGRFQPGEHVAIWAPNSADWVLLELAMALSGLTLVTVNPAFRAAEATHVLRQSRAAGVFIARSYRDTDLGAVVAAIRPGLPHLREVVVIDELAAFARHGATGERLPVVDPGSPAQLQYTSGTTGFPKGALLRHIGITNNSRLLSERLEVAEGSVWLNQMPMFHTGGCVLSTLGPLQRLCTQIILPTFDPELVLDLIETERVATTGGVPTMLLALMNHPAFASTDISSLSSVSSGGAGVPADLVRRIEQTLQVSYATMFGQTEAAPGITMTRLSDRPEDKAETVGTALPWNEIAIVDPVTLTPRQIGEVGEMVVRSPMVMAGYFDAPEETAAAIVDGGWLRTGDLGTMDDRGFCRVVGRVKDMITRGGENVYPAEVERVLLSHPAVADVAVIGLPDPTWGEQVAAVIVPSDSAGVPDVAELTRWTRDRLASFKVPRAWSFAEGLPTNDGGKVQKYLLRERWDDRPS